MQSWKKLKNQLLKDPEIKTEYKKLMPKYQIISQIIRARKEQNLTQLELANILKTKQSAIARIETGKANLSLNFLEKLATALNTDITIKIKSHAE